MAEEIVSDTTYLDQYFFDRIKGQTLTRTLKMNLKSRFTIQNELVVIHRCKRWRKTKKNAQSIY